MLKLLPILFPDDLNLTLLKKHTARQQSPHQGEMDYSPMYYIKKKSQLLQTLSIKDYHILLCYY